MEQAGADVIHVSHGIAIHSYYSGSGFNIGNVKRVKESVSSPVIGVGRMNDPALIASALVSGAMDFVSLGRAVRLTFFREKAVRFRKTAKMLL